MIKSLSFKKLAGYCMLCFFLTSGCKDSELDIGQLILNWDLEKGSIIPSDWNHSPVYNYELSWTEEEAFSPSRSIKISSSVEDPDHISYWYQRIGDDIPVGKKLTLKVKIKGNLTGTGVSLFIRGANRNGGVEQFATTGQEFISGTFDWTEHTLTMDEVLPSTVDIMVYLIYNTNTVGEVYFDNILLLH